MLFDPRQEKSPQRSSVGLFGRNPAAPSGVSPIGMTIPQQNPMYATGVDTIPKPQRDLLSAPSPWQKTLMPGTPGVSAFGRR